MKSKKRNIGQAKSTLDFLHSEKKVNREKMHKIRTKSVVVVVFLFVVV